MSEWYSPNHGLLPPFRNLFDEVEVAVVDVYPTRISDYKSKVTVFEEGEMVTSKIIEVNHPLTYKGYTFYQADYDKEEGRYTVLQVVKDPGVWLVMFGFACLLLGVIQKFYIQPFQGDTKREGR